MFQENERTAGIACFGLITDADDRVLLVRQNYREKMWALPGGMAMPGESMVQSARREVREETGLEVELSDLVSVADRGDLLLLVFRGRSDETLTTPQVSEIDECRWFTRAELDDLGDAAFALAVHSGREAVTTNGLLPVTISGGGGDHVVFS